MAIFTNLASILDICTRKIVGFSYSKKMNKHLVISALKNAYINQNCPIGVILHSDRGSRYASNDYISLVTKFNMKLSYSKKDCPFDNDPMESFHASLKKEEVYLRHYLHFNDVKLHLFGYIEGFYNRNRIHSVINFLTHLEFKKSFL